MITHIDHIVLTVRDIPAAAAFYEWVLGLDVKEYEPNRFAIFFGSQKINLHQAGQEFEPKARSPLPGSADAGCGLDAGLAGMTRGALLKLQYT